jgi:methyl-accepting chemotaxis protein
MKGKSVKNISLATKIGVLVLVMFLTGAAIAVVGLRQLADANVQMEELVNRTCRALRLANLTCIELLQSVRAEKNAILVTDKSRAIEWADKARQHNLERDQHRKDLAGIVETGQSSREGKALNEFDRKVEELDSNQRESLRLAVIKSNVEARAILHQELGAVAQDFEDFALGLGESAASPRSPTSKPDMNSRQAASITAAREVVDRLYGLLYHLSAHPEEVDSQVLTQADVDVRSRLMAFQESMRRFSMLLSDEDRARGSSVLASLETIKQRTARVQELLRANTDNLARRITTTKTSELTNRSIALMGELVEALRERLNNEKRIAEAQYVLGRTCIVTTGGIGLTLALALAILIIRSITQPVDQGIGVFEAMAGGDLTRRMNFNRRDEIGRLGAASDAMAVKLCHMVTQIRALAGGLGESAVELSGVSHDLLAQSHEVATQAETVASGTEQLSSNISSMAAAAEQMSVNVSSISSAAEEVSVNIGSISAGAESASRNVGAVAESMGKITTSLQDVARDAKKGSQMTQQALDMAGSANLAMQKLDQAAKEITKVTEVIKSIAVQTNLLALNATIEAASAGEAGRGFAVVAGEIKDLASQSGQSAEEIATKIESVQVSTREAVKVIDGVARSIAEINTSAGRISEAVGDQTQIAGQIAGNVAQARKGVEDISRSIAEVAKGADDASGNTAEASTAANDVSRNAAEAANASHLIASNIHGVSDATRQNSASAVKVDEAARRLRDIATRLQRSVEHFNTGAQVGTADHA